jgi:FkbM family methyltransferase
MLVGDLGETAWRFGTNVAALAGRFYDRLPCKQPVLSMLKPLGLPHSIYRHLHFIGEFEVATPRGPFRRFHHGDEIENELFWEGLPGRRERVSMELWMGLCQKAQVILDVGANTGIYSLVAAAMNPGARVYGFEPITPLFERYERNCRLNGFDVRTFRTALSNAAGKGVMRGWVLEKGTETRAFDDEVVPTTRLDAMIESCSIGRVDLAKIDVEGHEPEVLEGMGRFLGEFRPTLLIEVLSDRPAKKVEAFLGDLGYLYFDLDEIGAPRLMRHIRASSHWNYLVCSPATASGLGIA